MNATDLRTFLRDRFNDAELRALAFDLAIPIDDLGAADSGHTERVQALIEWSIRHGRLDELERAARLARKATQTTQRQSVMTDQFADYSQIARLIAVTDDMNRNVNQLSTDVQILKRDVNRIDERLTKMEAHTAAPQPTWQAWGISIAALVFAVLAILAMANLR